MEMKCNEKQRVQAKEGGKYEIPLSVAPPAPPPFWAIRHTSEDCRRQCFAGYKKEHRLFQNIQSYTWKLFEPEKMIGL